MAHGSDVLGKDSAGKQRIGAEREFEIGKDEAWSALMHMLGLNMKRTYDEYQDIALTAARRSQTGYDQVQAVSLQALQNAVESANMTSKQAVRHGDLAIDRQWNLDEVATLAAAVGSAVAKALNPVPEEG